MKRSILISSIVTVTLVISGCTNTEKSNDAISISTIPQTIWEQL